MKHKKILFAVVWNNKKHLIAKHNLIQPIKAGGLKMISIYDVVKTAKIMLIKRICNDIEATWKVLAQHLMDVTITDLYKKLSVRSLNCKPKLNFWYNFIATKPQNFSELVSQPIFYNDLLP